MRQKILRYVPILFIILLFGAVLLISKNGFSVMKFITGKPSRKTVVIDAGHGGFDPGKISASHVLEKDINLSIALKVKTLLENNDIKVVMTRTSDDGLYEESDRNKKSADLKKRVELIKESEPDIAVSIHQNSFPQESSKGAQVFYYVASNEGKELASILQQQLLDTLKDGNHRVAKSNDSYYLLKKIQCPFVIVECGFLSNNEEAKKLSTPEYQDKLAWAIHLGILRYLNNEYDN